MAAVSIDGDRVAATLAAAFAHEPSLRWRLRDDAWADWARLRYLQFLVNRIALPFGEVRTSPDGAGAILWMPRHALTLPWRTRLALTLEGPRWTGWSRRNRPREASRRARRIWPRGPVGHILSLGVERGHRHPGAALDLLATCLESSDRAARGLFFETSNRALARGVRRLGFDELGGYDLPENGPRMLVLGRQARAPEAELSLEARARV